MAVLYAMLVGFWLAGLQVTMFFGLQARCTATLPSFLAVTGGWLLGSLVGLWLPRKWAALTILLAGLAPALLLAWLHQAPFQPGLLPLFTLLVGLGGLYAGQFFRNEQASFARPGQLFFWENNGFLLGLGSASLACLFWGTRVGRWWPLGGLLILGLWLVRTSKRQEKSATLT